MKTAFVVNLDTEEGESLSDIADRINSLLEKDFVVLSVKPWARPSDPEATRKISSRGQQIVAALLTARAQKP